MTQLPAPPERENAARRLAVYRSAVRATFAFLKSTRRYDEALVRSIPLADGAGYLVPVCELHTTDEASIERFSACRAADPFASPAQLPRTDVGTRSWLRERLLDLEDRILFLVLDAHGAPVGHLGLSDGLGERAELEITDVVRGAAEAPAEIMSHAMTALLEWARETLGPEAVYVRVSGDDAHAIEFHERLGFVRTTETPLRRHENGETVEFRAVETSDAAPPDKVLVRLDLGPPRAWPGTETILTAGPSISAREASYVWDAARTGWNHHWADYIKRFEKAFAEYVGTRYALGFSSCTGALHLALLAVGVGPGDEVIVPDITWVASANAVAYTGATPVFADVQLDTWCLDPAAVEAAISPRTKAIVPVHLYGHPTDMNAILGIARRHGLRVIEDAAPAIGAECHGRRVGGFGDFGAFSFQGAKLLVTGEGGMLVTDDDELYKRVYTLWDQGRTPGTFWIGAQGWKYKMANVQAALGLGQIERIAELIEAKRRIFDWYACGLAGIPGIHLNHEASWARSIYWMTSIRLDESLDLARDALRTRLAERKIDTRPVFPTISQYPIWPRRQPPCPTATRIAERSINLPSGVCLTRQQVDYVCAALADELRKG